MPSTADARAGRAAFTHPGFVLFQIARFLIVSAVEMQAVAVGWQVYEITKRPLDLGYVGLAQFLPAILLFPIQDMYRTDMNGGMFSRHATRAMRCASHCFCS